MAVAIVTGGSKGLGRALSTLLVDRGWDVVIDGRTPSTLDETLAALRNRSVGSISGCVGDIKDPEHRAALVRQALAKGAIDLVVNNASTLGPTPLPSLVAYPLDAYREVFEINVLAPLALVQAAWADLSRARSPRVLNITSDAGSDAYPGWGGYGSTKAALEQWGAVLAVEAPGVQIWSVDPGDMRTDMHQAAFAGEDISDRPPPDEAAEVIAELVESDLASGRYRVGELPTLLSSAGSLR
jgi:NAD(P)-dependent dehydrogenase (short-subunit alcohol dehydrogenase family)